MAKTDTGFSKYYYIRERMKRLLFEMETWHLIHENLSKTAAELKLHDDSKNIAVHLRNELISLRTQLREMNTAMDGLSERDKYICELRYLDGRTWSDIQVLTQLSETRVMETNRKIRKHFKDKGKLHLIEDGK